MDRETERQTFFFFFFVYMEICHCQLIREEWAVKTDKMAQECINITKTRPCNIQIFLKL